MSQFTRAAASPSGPWMNTLPQGLQPERVSLTAGNFHTGPVHSRRAAAAGQTALSAVLGSFRTAGLGLAGSWGTVTGLPGQARSPAAARGSSAGWGTAAGSRSAAARRPAGTQPAAGCTGSFLEGGGDTEMTFHLG